MNTSTKISNKRTRSSLSCKEYEERKRASSISLLLMELKDCKNLIKELKGTDTSSFNKLEMHHHKNALDLELRKRKMFIQRLSDLGYAADKRGRPKKDTGEKYKSVHERMTVYFTPGNLEYLKSLKNSGTISNISSFINELVISYIRITGGEEDEN